MAIGDALTAPTGVQNQMYGQPSRVPGYSQGLGQAPGQMALPPEPMPIGRPTAVVGGPAYFTPQGYNAPPQPTQAFMPTDVRPDPIGQQFMRQMQSPMGQQFQAQYEATQAPIREAEMARRAEEQAAQDARFQEMMDRIAELEGQLATPEPAPMPGPDPYVPGGPFPGIPDFIRDLDFSNIDFSNLPDFSNLDYDDIMNQYRDRMEMGEPEPIDSFLPGPRADAGAMPPENNFFVDGDGNLNVGDGIIRPMPVDEPRFTTMPVPDGTGGEVMSIGDMLEGRVTRMPVGDPVPFVPEAIRDIIERREEPITRREEPRLMPMPVREPKPAPVMPRISMPKLPDFQSPVVPTPEPRPNPSSFMQELRAGDIMPNGPVVDRRPSPRMPAPPAVSPINIPNIPNIPNIDFSNLPKFDLPTTGGRPMIPDFGNFNLR